MRPEIILTIFAAGGAPTHGQNTHLRPIARPQLSELVNEAKRSLLPSGANVVITPKQYYVLKNARAQDLDVVPLYFHYDSPPSGRDLSEQCGILFKDSGSQLYIVRAVGLLTAPGIPPDACGGVLALGLASGLVPRPPLITIFLATSGHGEDYPLPVILTYNSSSHQYGVDQDLTNWVNHQDKADTVSQVRALLSKH